MCHAADGGTHSSEDTSSRCKLDIVASGAASSSFVVDLEWILKKRELHEVRYMELLLIPIIAITGDHS